MSMTLVEPTIGFRPLVIPSGVLNNNILELPLVDLFSPVAGNTYTIEVETQDNTFGEFSILEEMVPTCPTITKDVGGLRIKEIREYTSNSDSNPITTQYTYEENGAQTGVLHQKPNYGGIVETYNVGANTWLALHIFNESIYPLTSYNGNVVSYEKVFVEKLGIGKTQYEYYIEDDPTNDPNYPNYKLPLAPPHPRVLDNSLLSKVDFDLTDNIIKEEYYTYELANYQTIPGIVYKTDGYTISSTNGLPPCAYTAVKIYENKTGRNRISTKSTIIDGVENVESYLYDSTNRHNMIVSKSMTNSDGKIYETVNEYIHDYSVTQLKDTLLEINMISQPFKILQKVDGIQVDGSEAIYDWFNLSSGLRENLSPFSFPRIYKQNRFELTWDANGSLVPGVWKNVVQYDKYDPSTGLIKELLVPSWSPITLGYNSSGDMISWNFINYNKIFSYYSGTHLLESKTAIDGTKVDYFYDKLMRFESSLHNCNQVEYAYNYHFKTGVNDHSYVKSKIEFPITVGSDLDSLIEFSYIDGLGRLDQIVKLNRAFGVHDIVINNEYNNKDQLIATSEPFQVNSNQGAYSAITNYDKTEFEFDDTPLNRPTGQKAPDWYWQNTEYSTNTNGEVSGYPDSTLFKVTLIDPEGNKIIQFKDKINRLILERRTNDNESQFIDTRRVYDDKNRLTKIVLPSASGISNLQYSYSYAGNDLILTKKIPDRGIEEFIYNDRDLLAYSQHGNQKLDNEWYVKYYDQYGRSEIEGLTSSTPLSNDGFYNPPVSTIDTLIHNTYGTSGIEIDKLVEEKVDLIDESWTYNKLYFYDSCGRIEKTEENSLLNPVLDGTNKGLVINFSYDAMNNIINKDCVYNYYNRTDSLFHRYEYDQLGRQKDEFLKINDDSEIHLSNNTYTIKDQIASLKLGPSGSSFLQKLDYTYLPNRFLKGINENAGSSDIFKFCAPTSDCITPPGRKDGNINNLTWEFINNSGGPQAPPIHHVFAFQYDFLSRITDSDYYAYEVNNGSNQLLSSYNGRFDSEYTYDDLGNLLTLSRNGQIIDTTNGGSITYDLIDDMTYNYFSGSNKIEDINEDSNLELGFKLNDSVGDYNYDTNGNVIYDPSSATEIYLNYLNLPDSIAIIDSQEINEDIDIIKHSNGYIQKEKYCNPTYTLYLNQNEEIDKFYYANAILANSMISPADSITYISSDSTTLLPSFTVPLGSVFLADTLISPCSTTNDSWQYNYYIKDHLGNTRAVFSDINDDGNIYPEDILTTNDYYPFGMKTSNIKSGKENNPYLYNGKELEDAFDLGWYNYGARFYDPSVGKFTTIDPLASSFPSWNPYSYSYSNPNRFIDPDGRAPEDIIRDEDGNVVYVTDGSTADVSHPSGSNATVEVGYVFADDGTPIQVFNNVSGGEGWCTNCHGTTLADGEVWLNNDQVPALIEGDNYEGVSDISEVQEGDKVVYLGGQGEAEHSVTIESTDGTIEGTKVHGLGGLETQTHTDKLTDGWPQAQGVAVFRKNTPDKVANHAEIKQLREKVYPPKKD